MLILTRRIGEEIVINDDVVVRIMGVNGMCVRLGIYERVLDDALNESENNLKNNDIK